MLQYFLHEKKEISPILKKSPIKFSSKLTFFHIFYNDLRLIGWLWLTNLVAYSFVFLTRSSTNLSVKSNWKKKKIGLAFTGTSIFNPICSLNDKSFITGGSSFQISERGSSNSESQLGYSDELISSPEIVEASCLFRGRLCEAAGVYVPLSLLLPPLVCILEAFIQIISWFQFAKIVIIH